MTLTLKIASNAVVAKLFDAPEAAEDIVRETLSYTVENAGFTNAFSGGWNGRSTFYASASRTFPAGFVHLVTSQLKAAGFEVLHVKKAALAPLGPANPIVDDFGNDDPRYDFQMQAVEQVGKHLAGIVRVATGGGKSKISKLISAYWRRPTLFLTTRGVLMHQMRRHYEAQGFNVGVIGDGEWNVVRGINVGMVQTLVSHLNVDTPEAIYRDMVGRKFRTVATDPAGIRKELYVERDRRIKLQEQRRERALKVLELFEVVIGEEAHEAGGASYFAILQACKNARIRVALTATPFMRSAEEDNMRLVAAFGPLLINVSEETLIARGILAKPYFRFVTSRSPDKLKGATSYQRAYELGFTENDFLNADVVADALKAKRHGLPVMTLVQRTKHGTVLRDRMKAAGLAVAYIKGENDNDERQRALAQLGRGEIDVLIGTNILDVGVDVPAIGLVQLAGGGKAEIAMRQRIGRGLRAKKTGPNVCFVADYSTGINSHHKGHTAQRRAIVEGTPGFVEGIIPTGRDFPWDLFDASCAKAA